MGMQWNSTLGLSVFSLGPCYQMGWPVGMRSWKRRACCCMSWWACTLVELRQAFRRRKPQRWACRVARVLSVGWFDHVRNLNISLVVFLRGTCSGLGPSEGGIVYGLFSQEALCVGKASVYHTHCPGLGARLTEHIRGLYRPGLKDANKPWDRLLRRRLWSVRFFPFAVFPTISQGKVFGVVLLSKKLIQTSSRASQFGFLVRWDWTFFFLFALPRYEKNRRIVGLKGPSISQTTEKPLTEENLKIRTFW